jgi:nitrous-oxide reductase
MKKVYSVGIALFVLTGAFIIYSCKPSGPAQTITGDAATKAYVAPGKYDEFYNFVSGGFNGQMSVYGLPSK